MNIREILLKLSGKEISIKELEKLTEDSKHDKPVNEKLTKVVKLARSKKINRFVFKVEGAFKTLLGKKAEGKTIDFNSKDLGAVDSDLVDTYSHEEALSLGIIDGLGKLPYKDVYKTINQEILNYLKEDELVWRKPWRDGVRIKGKTYGPQNYVTQRPYRGVNAYLIWLKNFANKTEYNFFLTEKQVKERGGELLKGAKGTSVVAFIKSTKVEEHPEDPKLKSIEVKQGLIGFKVYALEETKGVKPIQRKEIKEDDKSEDQILINPQTIIDNMPKKPIIKTGGSKAFYVPSADYVQMPLKKAFNTLNEYYSTLFHELVHSTGSPKRLDRKFKPGTKFGDKDYAFEELIAELGAAYLCGVSEIEYFTLKNSAAYLKGWASNLRSEIAKDKTFFFKAVLSATKAAKYIIGETVVKTNKTPKNDISNANNAKKNAKKTLTNAKNAKKTVNNAKNANSSKVIELKKNTSIKTGVKAAIQDVLKVDKYKKIPEAYALMLYNSFKNVDSIPEDSLNSIKLSMFSKLGDTYKLIAYNDEAEDWVFVLTDFGKSLVTAIDGRLKTLQYKKSGSDLFPELKGSAIGKTIKNNNNSKKALHGIMSIASASETKFDLLGLDGEYLNMIGEACRPTSFFMYGPGGSGKSTFTLKFAHYLAQKGNKVAYVAGEQYNTPVLKKMLERLKLTDIANFHIVKNLEVINPGAYDVIVIDSKDSLDITHEDFKKLQEKFPKQTWAILSQATKDGGFTGSEKWRNLVDTMIYCEDGVAATGIDKNRWGGKNEIKIY